MQNQRTYLLANIPIAVTAQYDRLAQECADYETQQTPRYSITVTDEMIDYEAELFDEERAALEVIAFHRAFCERAIADDVLMFHASAVMVDNKAYLFAAPSGTGKSTHARLWREMLGDRVIMINDDKPFLRKENGRFTVYGSPWMGKHRLGNNISAPLAGVCFLNQGKENTIRQLTEREKHRLLLLQIYRPEKEESVLNMLRLMVELAEEIPMWQMDCTISTEAAELSYNTMTGFTK